MKKFFTPYCLAALVFLSCSYISNAQEKTIAQYTAAAPFRMPAVPLPSFAAHNYTITDYGATGDGQHLNTEAFAKAINACTQAGGGRVVVPPGLWLTGPIELKSNVDLHLEQGALVQFTSDHSQYPVIPASATSTNLTVASPIYGYSLKNIAITGDGIFDGAGESWRPVKKSKVTAAQWKDLTATGTISSDGSVWWPNKAAMDGEDYLKKLRSSKPAATAEEYLPARDFLRPNMLFLVNCDNILIEGVTLRNSPKFVFYPSGCTNLTMNRVNIFNEWWAQNGDGIDISACKNVVIYKCTVSAGDDGICMKSSGGKGGDDARLENVLVAGCTVYHAHGGFVIGSNTDGGMRNIFVTDCNFIGTDVGIRVKSNAGRGGLVHDIYISRIFMSNIVNEAVSFDTFYEDVPAGKSKEDVKTAARDKLPVFRDFHLEHVYCRGAAMAISIVGLPDMPVSRIYFNDVVITAQDSFKQVDATEISMKEVRVYTPKGMAVSAEKSER